MIRPNKGTFYQGGSRNGERSIQRTVLRPRVTKSYLDEILASQGGNRPSRPVSEAEEEQMMNRIWAQDYRKYRGIR